MTEHARVLLVEDDPALRTMLRGVLSLADFEVAEAGDRQAALQALREQPDISLVVLDLGLPPAAHTIDEGVATLRDIRVDANTCKVVVLTGQDQDDASLAAIREGAFDFLAKPASAEAILSAVRRAQLFLRKERELYQTGLARIAISAHIGDGLKAVRDEAEERLVRQVLKETGFNVYQTAKRLGVKRENIYYFLKKFGIEREEHG